MVSIGTLVLSILIFISGWHIVRRLPLSVTVREWLYIILSMGVISIYTKENSLKLLVIYIVALVFNFFALKYTPRYGWFTAAVRILPIVYLITYKVMVPYNGIALLGVSYLCLRLLRFNVDYKNEIFGRPTLSCYLGFCFFYPSFIVGPINKFSEFDDHSKLDRNVVYAALFRIVVGLGKYFVLGLIVSRLDFTNLWSDGRLHGVFDFLISSIAYLLFLYCNFSGFVDIMLGTARLCGVVLPENFASPFSSRNIKEFWNRWHITLSVLARDMVFTPLSKFLVRVFGPSSLNWSIAISILCTFLLVGVWHGNGLNFVLFGAWHGLGLALNHGYTVVLKKRLGKKLRDYEKNPWITSLAVASNFIFVSLGMFFFENNWSQIKAILNNLVRFYAL